MKILALFISRRFGARSIGIHNDSLRAGQSGPAVFSPWKALVS